MFCEWGRFNISARFARSTSTPLWNISKTAPAETIIFLTFLHYIQLSYKLLINLMLLIIYSLKSFISETKYDSKSKL